VQPSRKQYILEYQRKWLRKRREEWFSKNGPCAKCGSKEELELDHIDPATKVDHSVWSWSEERRLAELAKCQVLCGKCHKEKTAASVRKLTHGTVSSYLKGCRCEQCVSARSYSREKSEAARRLKTDGPSRKSWTKDQDAIAISMYIGEAANALGKSKNAVSARRARLAKLNPGVRFPYQDLPVWTKRSA